jgi:regulator of protease activity HflC (stomatin/prohibitin superfamily)
MVAIIFIGLFALLTLVGIGVLVFAKNNDRYDVSPKAVGGGFAAVFLVLTLSVWLFNSVFSVEARTVGIVTEFGKATGTVQPGFNFLAPWAEVTEFPTTAQPLDFSGTDGTEGQGVPVKFAGGGQGWININVNWKVKGDDEAIKLWNSWKDFDKVTNRVVVPRVRDHAAFVAGSYGPLDAVNSENNPKMAKAIKDKLNAELKSQGIEVMDVSVGGVDVDEATQKRINSQAQKKTDIDNAKLDQERAVVDNETKRQSQELLTPQALIDQCLKITNNWDVNKNGPLPANWNCFAGGGLPVTVGVK